MFKFVKYMSAVALIASTSFLAHPMPLARERIDWLKFALGLMMTLIVSLSVHVVMLQVIGVPFPDLSVITPFFIYLAKALATLGLIYLWQAASPSLRPSFLGRCAALFLFQTMVNENLIRGPFMQGYCTEAFVFAFVGSLKGNLAAAVSSALIVATAAKLSQPWHKVLAALIITALALYAVTPLIGLVMAPVMASLAQLAHQREWCSLPYGANVLIPAYLTFAEPVLACVLAAVLAWDRLAPGFYQRLGQFTLLIVMIRYQLLLPFAYALFAKIPALAAFISESQFALEAVALGLGVGLTLEWSRRSDGNLNRV